MNGNALGPIKSFDRAESLCRTECAKRRECSENEKILGEGWKKTYEG